MELRSDVINYSSSDIFKFTTSLCDSVNYSNMLGNIVYRHSVMLEISFKYRLEQLSTSNPLA